MKGVIYMSTEKQTFNRRKHLGTNGIITVIRVLLTPILIWYRLYLWVWDGTMFDK